MAKKPKFSYQQYLSALDDTADRKSINAIVLTAMDQWRNKELSDYAISDVLKKAAAKIISIY